MLETASKRVKDAQYAVDKCTCRNGKKKRSVDRALADIKKEEALLLDLLRFIENALRLHSAGTKLHLDAERFYP